MKTSPVDRLYEESKAAVASLELSEPSLASAASDNFRKALLLASASHFESRLASIVIEYIHELSEGSIRIISFVKSKAIARQFHSWFDWNSANANQFFSFFGPDFKEMMVMKVKDSDELKLSISAFMEIGRERNKLVHQDYATFAFDKTLDEVHGLYRKALLFVDSFPAFLREGVKEVMPSIAVSGGVQHQDPADGSNG